MTDSSNTVPPSFDPEAALAEVAEATAHLLNTATDLTDEDVRGPSLCDGWTRAHVLTHIARNADGLCNMLNTASTGEVTPMYESDEKRNADIDAGSSRSAAELLADLQDSAERFVQAYQKVGAEQWGAETFRTLGAKPGAAYEIGGKRLAEVLIHHVDLAADYTPAHWPDTFTDAMFDIALKNFGAREDFPPLRLDVEEDETAWFGVRAAADDTSVLAVRGPKRALLAWLLGRASGDGLVAQLPEGGRGPLPALPSWG